MKKFLAISLVFVLINSGNNLHPMEPQREEPEESTTFNLLPDLVIKLVIENLSYHGLCQCNLVSKRYREITLEVLKERIEQLHKFIPHTNLKDGEICFGELFGQNRNIQQIMPGVFDCPAFAKIKKFFLFNKQMEAVPNHAFRGLPKLITLHLYNNQITTIEPHAFANLFKLKNIYLHSNLLTDIPAATFAIVPNLQNLYLSNNPLSEKTKTMLEQLKTRGIKVYI